MDDHPLFEFIDNEGNDIRDEIIASSVKNLDRFITQDLPKKTIALVWVVGNDITDYMKIRPFMNFQTDDNLEKQADLFVKQYNKSVKIQKEISKKNRSYVKDFLKVQGDHETSEFSINENIIGGKFNAPSNYMPTEEIPIFKSDSEIRVWKDYRDIDTITGFSELDVEKNKVIFIDSKGSNGVFDNVTGEIEFSTTPDNVDNALKNIERSLGAEIKDTQRMNIKGEFVIKNVNIDRRIFALLLVRKGFYEDRVILDEAGKILSEKDRFQMKYWKNTMAFGRPSFISLSNTGENLTVKLAKVPNESMVQNIKLFVLGMLNDYKTSRNVMVARYKKDSKSLTFTTKDIIKKKPSTQATKTKQKLGPLQERNPELFGFKGYARLCPASDQPMIPDAKKVQKLLKTDPSRIVEYPKGSGDYYTCDHIKNVKKGESKVREFPGLRPDTESIKTGRVSKYAFVPCCYPIDQYKKKSSGLNKYRNVGNEPVSKKEGGILDKQKKLGDGRKGLIPTSLQEIMEFHGMKTKNYLRHGLPPSNQSILDAAAFIKYNDEWNEDPESARSLVFDDLDSSTDINAGLQSYSISYMRDALENRDMELKAENFAPVLEFYLKAVVVVIEGDEYPVPDTKFGFIPQLFMRKRLVILYKHKGSQQVEVVGTYQGNFDMYADRKTITRFLRSKRDVFGFYSGTGYTYPKYAKLVSNSTKQYIDKFGKCRGFIVDGQSVFMAPTAPTNRPITKKKMESDPKGFAEEYEMDILYEDDNALYTEKFVLYKTEDYGYQEPSMFYTKPYIIPRNSFFIPSYKSEVNAIRLMEGENVEVDKITEKLYGRWKELGVDAPRLQDERVSMGDVVVLKTQRDTVLYTNLLRTLGLFKWEKLTDVKHSPGTVHYILLDDGSSLTVLDIVGKPGDTPTQEGMYDVSFGRKIRDGPGVVRYFGNKYGIIQ